MKRTLLILLIALLWGNRALLCAQTEVRPLPWPEDTRCRQWTDSVLAGMNLPEKVGQLLLATLPAKADKQEKKQLRDLLKKHKVGGLSFTEGTPEEQAILTNLAQKTSQSPLLIATDSECGLSQHLEDVPRFPKNAALGCIGDNRLIDEYGREVAREFRELGIQITFVPDADTDTSLSSLFAPVHSFGEDEKLAEEKESAYRQGLESGGVFAAEALKVKDITSVPRHAAEALLAGGDMLKVQHAVGDAVKSVLDAVKDGVLTESEIETKCRKILAYKYHLGLHLPRKPLRVSGMSFRIRTDSAQALAARLRQAAVTVLGNHFGILPLTPAAGAPIAVLSVGEGDDHAFMEEMQRLSPVPVEHLRLTREMTAADRRELADRLAAYRRIVISVSGRDVDLVAYADFLAGLDVPAPLVYAFFASYREMRLLEPALKKSSAVLLGHSSEPDIQQHVAKVLFAKAPAQGRLSMNIGLLYQAGEGCMVTSGMKPGNFIPEDLGMKSYELHRIDAIVRAGLDAKAYPGCQVLVLKDGRPVYHKCFGTHSDKDTTAVRPTDMFDLASLTKTTATLLAVMKLYDEGRLKLTDKASHYLPFLRNTNKKNITLKELLLHESGLPPYIRFYMEAIDPNSVHGPYAQSWVDQWHHTQVSEHSYYCSDFKFKKGLVSSQASSVHTLHVADGMWLNKSFKNTILQQIARCDMDSKRYVYSDLGFILLQQVVEAIVKLPMDLYLAKEFYAPMGLQRTLYQPLQRYSKQEIMPTASNDFLRRQDLCGYVHDEAAACLGGISGNAGLFSTAIEVAMLYQMLLNGGELNGKRYLSEATCRLFTTETSAISRRGLGFDKPDLKNPKSNPCASSALSGVYGHTGFTGTCVWADPVNRMVYVFLSNRLCPNVWNTKLGEMNIRTDIQEAIYRSLK